MAVNPSPFGPKPQFELADGEPAVGGKLFFYVAGSVGTKQNTYTDSTGLSANTNPILLNALGMPPNEIWFTAGQSYKVVYAPSTDTDPPSSPIWTIDNLLGINDTTVPVDQWVPVGLTPTYVSAVSFTLTGDQTGDFTIGRRLRFSVTAGTVYGTISNSAFAALTTVTMTMNAGQALDSGLSSVDLSLLTSDVSAVPQIISAGTGIAVTYTSGKPSISISQGPGWNLLSSYTAAGSATLDFQTPDGLTATYDRYLFDITALAPATDDVALYLRVGTGVGPTWQAANYIYGGRFSGPAAGADTGSTIDGVTSAIALSRPGAAQGIGNAAGEVFSGQVLIENPTATGYRVISSTGGYMRSDAVSVNHIVTGTYTPGGAITGVRFLMSSGNIASGTIRLYGLRK